MAVGNFAVLARVGKVLHSLSHRPLVTVLPSDRRRRGVSAGFLPVLGPNSTWPTGTGLAHPSARNGDVWLLRHLDATRSDRPAGSCRSTGSVQDSRGPRDLSHGSSVMGGGRVAERRPRPLLRNCRRCRSRAPRTAWKRSNGAVSATMIPDLWLSWPVRLTRVRPQRRNCWVPSRSCLPRGPFRACRPRSPRSPPFARGRLQATAPTTTMTRSAFNSSWPARTAPGCATCGQLSSKLQASTSRSSSEGRQAPARN